jgi:hypothetical protein
MALSIEEQRNLRDLLALFFPQDRARYAENELNEETLEKFETMLIEVNSCTVTAQRFIEDLAGNRMIRGFLRKSLNKMLHALKGKDAKYVGNIGCTNVGKANFRRDILATIY